MKIKTISRLEEDYTRSTKNDIVKVMNKIDHFTFILVTSIYFDRLIVIETHHYIHFQRRGSM